MNETDEIKVISYKLDKVLHQQAMILALLQDVKPVQGTRWKVREIEPEWAKWAEETRPDVDWEAQYREFQDYWIGATGKKAIKTNWFSTWKNWIRRSPAKSEKSKSSWENNDIALARKARELGVEASPGETWDKLRTKVAERLRG